jgi:uncharacterized Ntn-hydrolase superfamily protein
MEAPVTYSIVARDPETGDLGVAVQSKFLAVGSVVPWARAGVGAVATQAYANTTFGAAGLGLLDAGASAGEALERLIAEDPLRAERQVGIVDAGGRSATHTGRATYAWAGGRTAQDVACQGNILAGPGVVDALLRTFHAGGLPFPELLVACLAAGEAAGGDRRGRQSAALLVVRAGGGYGGHDDRWIDLRVDDHPEPIGELARLLSLHRLYLDRPTPVELIPMDATLAAEVRDLLERAGSGAGSGTGSGTGRGGSPSLPRMWPDEAPPEDRAPAVGEPRPLPQGWDGDWQRALLGWMSIENLEERTAAPGWLDPRVLSHLREAATGRSRT